MKKHGAIPGKTKREIANPWFSSGVEKRRKKNKIAKKSRKRNR